MPFAVRSGLPRRCSRARRIRAAAPDSRIEPYPQRALFARRARCRGGRQAGAGGHRHELRHENRGRIASAARPRHRGGARTVRGRSSRAELPLKRVAQILELEAAQRCVGSAHPCHGFEALAHLARQHQLPRLIGEPRMAVLVAARRASAFRASIPSPARKYACVVKPASAQAAAAHDSASHVKSTHAVMS